MVNGNVTVHLFEEASDARTLRLMSDLFCEISFLIVDVGWQAKELEEKISIASDAHYTPSVMELELETRLNHLTDNLIQKQAQVMQKPKMLQEVAM
jgi:hypothetical protein